MVYKFNGLVVITILFFTINIVNSKPVDNDNRQHDLKRLAHLRHKINRVQNEHRSDRLRIEQLEKIVEKLTDNQMEQSSLEEQRANLNEQHEQLQKMYVEFKKIVDIERSLKLPQDLNVGEDTKLEISNSDNNDSNGDTDGDDRIAYHRNEVSRNEFSGNEAAATQWMKEEVAIVQNLVKEVKEECNVTSAIHEKEITSNRLQALESDYAVLRKEVSSAVSKSESTQALLEAFRQEGKTQTSEQHNNGARVANLESQVSSLREDFNDMLAALPDGILSPGNAKTEYNTHVLSGNSSMSESNFKTQGRTHFLQSNTTLPDDRHYGEWIQNLRSSLSKVKESSVQLLDAVDNLEIRQETDRVQLLREIAKLEFNVSTTSEEMKIYQDSLKKEYGFFSDVLKVKDTVDKLQKELLEKDARITDTNYRLESLAGTVFEFMNKIKPQLGDSVLENVEQFQNQKQQSESQKKFNES